MGISKLVLCASAAIACATTVCAQEAEPEEVVVTATRSERAPLDVPAGAGLLGYGDTHITFVGWLGALRLQHRFSDDLDVMLTAHGRSFGQRVRL